MFDGLHAHCLSGSIIRCSSEQRSFPFCSRLSMEGPRPQPRPHLRRRKFSPGPSFIQAAQLFETAHKLTGTILHSASGTTARAQMTPQHLSGAWRAIGFEYPWLTRWLCDGIHLSVIPASNSAKCLLAAAAMNLAVTKGESLGDDREPYVPRPCLIGA